MLYTAALHRPSRWPFGLRNEEQDRLEWQWPAAPSLRSGACVHQRRQRSYSRSPHACHFIILKLGHCRQSVPQLVASHDLESHLPNSPGVIAQSGDDRLGGLVLPGPQQASGRPHPQPVRGPTLLTGQGPASWRSAKRHDELRIYSASLQKSDAAGNNSWPTALAALVLHTLLRCQAPGCRRTHGDSVSLLRWRNDAPRRLMRGA